MQPDDPVVSIVIPARNEAPYIGAALQSVVDQDYPPERLQCVVVDNASSDGTAAIVQEFAARHPGLAVATVDEPRPGVSHAKNRGAETARGAILLFVDADSRLEPGLVRDVVAAYRTDRPAGSIKIVADGGDLLERGFFALLRLGPLLFGIRSQMFYCERELFLALGGFDPALKLGEDLDFMRRLREHVKRHNLGDVPYLQSSAIATSPRRLRTRRFHLAVLPMFGRWLLSFLGIGRDWDY